MPAEGSGAGEQKEDREQEERALQLLHLAPLPELQSHVCAATPPSPAPHPHAPLPHPPPPHPPPPLPGPPPPSSRLSLLPEGAGETQVGVEQGWGGRKPLKGFVLHPRRRICTVTPCQTAREPLRAGPSGPVCTCLLSQAWEHGTESGESHVETLPSSYI